MPAVKSAPSKMRARAILLAASTALAAHLAASTSGPASAQALDIIDGSLAERLADLAGEPGTALDALDTELPDDPTDLTAEEAGEEVIGAGDALLVEEEETDEDALDDFTATLALRAGYDTNFDEEVEAVGSAFVAVDASIEGERTVGGTDLFASVRGSVIELFELDVRTRYDATGAFGARREIADGLTVEAAGAIGIDGDGTEVTIDRTASIGTQIVRPGAVFGLRAGYGQDTTIVDRSDDDAEADTSGDTRRLAAEGAVLLRPGSTFSPVAEVQVTRIDFLADLDGDEEDEGTILDRDATEISALVGARLRPSDDLTVTAGMRIAHRVFDEPGAEAVTRAFPELGLDWDATERLNVYASVSRFLDEPDLDASRVQDVIAVAGGFSLTLNELVSFFAFGGYDRLKEIGEEGRSEEIFASAGVTIEPNDTLEGQLSVSHSRTNDLTFGDDTKSTNVTGRLSVSF